MTFWERLEILGDDSYGYEDGVRSLPGDFDYDDPRDYEEGCDWIVAVVAEGYYHADHLHEDGGFVYFNDAFGPELDLVALSAGGCAADRILLPSSELPYLHGDATIAPRDVPAVFRTGVRDAGGPDLAPVVLFPDRCAAKWSAGSLIRVAELVL